LRGEFTKIKKSGAFFCEMWEICNSFKFACNGIIDPFNNI
jgi:hypothetical protein